MQRIMMRQILFILMLSSIFVCATAQEKWSLDQCIQYALDHSLSYRQAALSINESQINRKIAEQGRMPTLDGNTSYNLSFGRRIDPTTNDFINSSFGNHGFSVSGGITIFNGGRITQQIKQARLGKAAAELDIQQIKNDLALQVSLAFIEILFAEENLGNAEKSLELINSQLLQVDKQIASGIRPRNARLDLVAEAAQNEQLVVTAQNDIEISYLNLKQILQLEASMDMQVEIPDLPLPTDYELLTMTGEQIYDIALGWQPSIKAGEVRRRNAEVGVALAKTNMVPSLSLGGSIGSNWSSSARLQNQVGSELLDQNFFVNGEPFNVQYENPIYQTKRVNYFDQVNQNIGYGFGLSATIPIYGQGRNKGNLELAKLEVVRSDLANTEVKNKLSSDVYRAVSDLKAASKQHESALRTVEARRAAFEDTEKKFNLGVADSFQFITAQNNRDRAETDLLVAKYDFIFRSKILEYYQGRVAQ